MKFRNQDIHKTKNYIDGELADAIGGGTLANYEPATGAEYISMPASDGRDVDAAVTAAHNAFPAWSTLTINERSAMLRKLSQLIEAHHEELALAESIDNGKPIEVTKTVDIARAAYNLRFYADAITQFSGESYSTTSNVINYIAHEPIGVVGCISPWNLPLYSFTWKIAPALAAW